MQIRIQLNHDSIMIESLTDVLVRISNEGKSLHKHYAMVNTQLEQVVGSQNDLFNELHNKN